MTSGPRRRLAVIDELLDAPVGGTVRARTSVWLLRLAIEHALADLWAARAPAMADATWRAQLLVLPRFLDAEDAWRVSELWHTLSRVAHHHAYELTPTRVEILTWRHDAEVCVEVLETRSTSAAFGG